MRRIFTLVIGLMTVGWASGQIVQSENFNSCTLPAGWTENIVTGDSSWLFVLNSPDPFNPGNIDGTCMCLFDDDYVGSAAAPSIIELLSPPIDLTSYGSVELEFDYNYNWIGADNVDVEVFDGTSWVNVLSLTADACGTWTCGPPYPHAEIDVTAYLNAAFQVRFTYNDGGVWAWYFGMDNFSLTVPPADDVGAVAIPSPVEGGCSLSPAETVTVTIENFGSDTASAFDVCFIIDGPGGIAGPVCETFAGTIAPGATMDYTFTATADLSLFGSYTVTGYTNLTGDLIPSNDSTFSNLDISAPIGLSIVDNFDSYLDGSTVFTTPLINSADDDLDWQVNYGPTGSVATGPTDDVTGGGGYIYMETSGSADGDQTILETPCIDLTGSTNPVLSFSYHMYGLDIDFLTVDIITSTTTNLVTFTGQQQFANTDPWLDTAVDLSAYIGQVVKLRWTGGVYLGPDGFTFNGDISLDEIGIKEVGPDDVGVSALTQPVLGACLLSAAENLEIEVTNSGTADQTGFDVCYDVAGPTGSFTACENVGALSVGALGGTGTYLFTGTVDMSLPGTYTITTWTDLTGDIDNSNDTLVSVLVIDAPVSLPVIDNFDSYIDGSTVFTSPLSNSPDSDLDWQVNFGGTGSVATGPSDDVSGGGGYLYMETSGSTDGDVAILESECIDLGSATNPVAAFSYHMFGADIDYLTLDIIAGGTITNLVTIDTPQLIASTDAWEDTAISLVPYLGQVVKLRWTGGVYLGPDGFTFNGDIGLDEISIKEVGADDLGVNALLAPIVDACLLSASETLTIQVINGGTADQTGFDVCYEVAGPTGPFSGCENVGALMVTGLGGTGDYTTTGTVDMSLPGIYTVTTYTTLPGDIDMSNDTLVTIIDIATPSTLPVEENFDGYADGTTVFTSPLANNPAADLAWQVNFGGTGSLDTGPADDVSGGGGYIYMETSAPASAGDVAILESACIDLGGTSTPRVSFSYHMYGGAIDSLAVDVITSTATNIMVLNGSQQTSETDPWRDTTLDLSAYAGQIVKIRWTGAMDVDPVTGFSFTADIGIDEISIFEPVPIDGGVISLTGPENDCELTAAENISVEIENFGSLPLTGFDVAYSVDGGTPVVENVGALSIPSLGAATYTFAATEDFSTDGAIYVVDAWTQIAGDGALGNDSLFGSSVINVVAPPVNTGFDTAYCITVSSIFPSPTIPGGTWAGLGIVDTATGELDPSLIGAGSSSTITYTFEPTGSYSVAEIAYAPNTAVAPITLFLGDDAALDAPVGFTFDFFGTEYTDVSVGSNGYISFSDAATSLANQFLPNPAIPSGLIAWNWDDLNPNDGGTITYETVGSAPNRKFIVYYDDIPHFGSGGSLLNTGQIVLYESTNIIDVITTEITTDGFDQTQGIENEDGTEGYTSTPLTNQQSFTQSNIAYRYSPTPCGAIAVTEVTIESGFTVDLGSDTTLCAGDSGVLDAGPGTAWEWSTGDTTQTIVVSTSGSYSVLVESAGGCAGSGSINVEVAEPLTIGGSKVNVLCAGEATGSFDLNVSGGVPPYDVLWSTGETTPSISGLVAGSYGVAVQDDIGCIASATEEIREPKPLIIDLDITEPSFGGSDGEITASGKGGISPYTYAWNTGATTGTISDLAPGTYTVTITDDAGCTTVETIVLEELPNGIEDIDVLSGFEIYPNPSEGVIQVGLELTQAFDVEISIYNSIGQLVTSTVSENTIGRTWSFDLSHVAAGSYDVKVNIGEYVVSRSVVIAH